MKALLIPLIFIILNIAYADSRVPSFNILCEGGKCDKKYIVEVSGQMEHFCRIIRDEVPYNSSRSKDDHIFFMEFHVVPVGVLGQLLKKYPPDSGDLRISHNHIFIINGEGYMIAFNRKNYDKSANLVLAGYVRELFYWRNGYYPSREYAIEVLERVAIKGKNTIDIQSLLPQ